MPHVFDTASELGIVSLHPHRDLTEGITYAPLFVGRYEIRKHYAALGGAGGFLGPQVGGFRNLADGGVSATYAGGSIYWSEATGAHEIHGAIRDKWLSLGGHAGFLGYPVTDEHTPFVVGEPGTRASLFQPGGIYWSPVTGAHETHGDIYAFWLASDTSLIPTTDELDFAEGGRVSKFGTGQWAFEVYWWPDTGALRADELVLRYEGLKCFGETDYDGGSNSDEPYFVFGIATPEIATAERTIVYSNVDSGDLRKNTDGPRVEDGYYQAQELYRGKPRGMTLSILLMENDDDDANIYLAPLQGIANASAAAMNPLVFPSEVGRFVAGSAADIRGMTQLAIAGCWAQLETDSDDALAASTISLSAKDMVLLAMRGDNQSIGYGNGTVFFGFESPLLSGEGASYKAFFTFLPF